MGFAEGGAQSVLLLVIAHPLKCAGLDIRHITKTKKARMCFAPFL
jgi:hypothetical protein